MNSKKEKKDKEKKEKKELCSACNKEFLKKNKKRHEQSKYHLLAIRL